MKFRCDIRGNSLPRILMSGRKRLFKDESDQIAMWDRKRQFGGILIKKFEIHSRKSKLLTFALFTQPHLSLKRKVKKLYLDFLE